MHESAYADAARFVDRYIVPLKSSRLRIVDIGSRDVNGSLRPLFAHDLWDYTGIDIDPGPNVDLVLPAPYNWPGIRTATYDIAVTTQTLEHVPSVYRWLREIVRIVKPGGLVYVCAPHTLAFHEHPIDCWRVWPDGMRGLMQDCGLDVCEVYATDEDTAGIARKRHDTLGDKRLKVSFDRGGVLDSLADCRDLAAALDRAGFEVYCISAVVRGWNHHAETERNLRSLCPYLKEVVFTPHDRLPKDRDERRLVEYAAGIEKANAIKARGITVHFDDNAEICRAIRDAGLVALHLCANQ